MGRYGQQLVTLMKIQTPLHMDQNTVITDEHRM